MVKTWRADELIPFAESAYKEMEEFFRIKFFHPALLFEIFSSQKHRNDWFARSADPETKNYIGDERQLPGNFPVHAPFGGIEIKHSSWLDLNALLSAMRKYLRGNFMLMEENFSCESIRFENGTAAWKNISASKIIFCEGYRAMENPLFSYLPFLPSKGETITISCPALPPDYILNRAIHILPLGKNLFKVGATNTWDDLNEHPTNEGKEKLIDLLKRILTCGFEIEEHHAGIRPTVKDRRPFIGLHPGNPALGIFNGLGTKGVLLAPWCAKHFVNHMTGSANLDTETDIRRFGV
jgi:glycine/D-amino acid oxidase-like deaminating enzyme